MERISVGKLEKQCKINRNTLRSKAKSDPRYTYVAGKITLAESVRLLEEYLQKEEYRQQRPYIEATLQDLKSKVVTKETPNGNKKASTGKTEARLNLTTDTPLVTKNQAQARPVTEKQDGVSSGNNIFASFLQSGGWKLTMALLAITVSSYYIQTFIHSVTTDLGMNIPYWVSYIEAAVFVTIGVTLTANNREKRIWARQKTYRRSASEGVKIGNIWLFVFFSLEILALLAAFSVITNDTFRYSILAAMPPVSLLAFAHLFIGEDAAKLTN